MELLIPILIILIAALGMFIFAAIAKRPIPARIGYAILGGYEFYLIAEIFFVALASNAFFNQFGYYTRFAIFGTATAVVHLILGFLLLIFLKKKFTKAVHDISLIGIVSIILAITTFVTLHSLLSPLSKIRERIIEKTKDPQKVLRSATEDRDPGVRAAAVSTFIELTSTMDHEAITQIAFKDPDEIVRRYAVWGIKDPGTLIRLASNDESICVTAFYRLVKFHGDTALLDMLAENAKSQKERIFCLDFKKVIEGMETEPKPEKPNAHRETIWKSKVIQLICYIRDIPHSFETFGMVSSINCKWEERVMQYEGHNYNWGHSMKNSISGERYSIEIKFAPENSKNTIVISNTWATKFPSRIERFSGYYFKSADFSVYDCLPQICTHLTQQSLKELASRNKDSLEAKVAQKYLNK